MSKKIILGLAIAGGLYYYLNQNKTEKPQSEQEEPGTPIFDNTVIDIFTQYNNKIVIDSKGYWMLIKDGKIYSFSDQAHLNTWQKANPSSATPITDVADIWEFYYHSTPEIFAGIVR